MDKTRIKNNIYNRQIIDPVRQILTNSFSPNYENCEG